jgi:hypothetical protein
LATVSSLGSPFGSSIGTTRQIDGAGDVRFIICYNPDQAERDRQQREQAIERIEAELTRIKAQRDRDAARARARAGQLAGKAKACAEDAHVRAKCALRDHPTLRRWIRQQPKGRLAIDRAKAKAEANPDGKYMLATSD